MSTCIVGGQANRRSNGSIRRGSSERSLGIGRGMISIYASLYILPTSILISSKIPPIVINLQPRSQELPRGTI